MLKDNVLNYRTADVHWPFEFNTSKYLYSLLVSVIKQRIFGFII